MQELASVWTRQSYDEWLGLSPWKTPWLQDRVPLLLLSHYGQDQLIDLNNIDAFSDHMYGMFRGECVHSISLAIATNIA